MAVGERQTQKQRRKMPSFSSSLLDAIYHSIDDKPMEQQQRRAADVVPLRRNAAAQVEEEVESLRRAIMVEKWMENYNNTATRHLPTNSGSSTDSSFFTSSETESSASRSTPKSSDCPAKERGGGRFTQTKSRALKIYGDLKKVKEPISPGGRIASFLNSIFSPRNLKKNQSMVEEWGGVRKSRSMKDTTTCSSASRSCLSKNTNPSRAGNAKSKRSVRFCPVNGGGGGGRDEYPTTMPSVGSQFIKKNIDSFRLYEVKSGRKHDQSDFDDKSCASSDLFELENIGAYDEELPVYGTTDVKMNRAIASGFNLIM